MKRVTVSAEEALAYHERDPPGKISVVPTKPALTARDLSLAYSPGVAEPCRVIARDPDAVFKYTSKGNLVAVITNGTAVLGLGDIGPLAGKPVMEGKGVLFKRFADINVFDIEVNEKDPERFIQVVKALEPTFGGINLEDIKAPECFLIEERLKKEMNIPVFHDDQHGTAIITGAALLNALDVVGKKPEDVRVVFSGAGASAIASAKYYTRLGVRRKNIVMCDSQGVLHEGRKDLNPYKAEFATGEKARTLSDALHKADVFVGLSVKGAVKPAMLKEMARDPIVFALANPDPEILPEEALAARSDAIVATGRSDFPNQVNNVLGFPFIFRGALDAQAREINEAMKTAASRALASLAREDVPDSVIEAYGGEPIRFGREYLIPKPIDPRVLVSVAGAVAQAAMESGAARKKLDVPRYREVLEARLGKEREIMRIVYNKAKREPKRIVFPEGTHEKILRACQILFDEGIARPILLGDPGEIEAKKRALGLDFTAIALAPWHAANRDAYADEYFALRSRKGATRHEAREAMENPFAYAAMMVRKGDADGLVGGLSTHYPDALRPSIQILGLSPGAQKVVGMYLLLVQRKALFIADATVNIQPTAQDLAEIAMATANTARKFDIEPRVAMLSFSNFGSSQHPLARKVAEATALVKLRDPLLMVDGEMQVDTALVPEILKESYPFSTLKEPANVLIFPNLAAANTAYKLLQRLSDASLVGPILEGLAKPAEILQRGDDVQDVVNMSAIAVVEAQGR